MSTGVSTGAVADRSTDNRVYRHQIQGNALLSKFSSTYDEGSRIGPTKEELALAQHQEDINNLQDEIAAKSTPQAVKEREESGFFSKSAQEKELAQQKDEVEKKKAENALEAAVKKDKYFLIKNEWDRKVIKAANGETVTVEVEDTEGKKNADGTYPKKVITIEKSSKLKKISDARPKPTGKTAAMVKEEFDEKREALREKYEAGFFTDAEEAKEKHQIVFNSIYNPVGGSPLAIAEYKAELAKIDEAEEKELASIANKALAEPAPQGLNVEPHTIAIYAPGFCMNSGCCLELAYYTLRAAAKVIEDDAEAFVDKDIKDVIDENKSVHERLEQAYKDNDKMYDDAFEEAKKLAIAAYNEAYKKYLTIIRDANGNPVNGGPKPDPKQYTPEIFLEKNPDLLDAYYADKSMIELIEFEVKESDEYLEDTRKKAFDALVTEAKNYRMLLEKCTFQPTCPEWLEDVGNSIADAAKKTGEAIVGAYEWCVDGVSSAVNWVAEGGITRTIDTVNKQIDDGLAYMNDLQNQLNEYLGFEGLCSLNPFGGTLGCANCPMGSKCSGTKKSLLDKLNDAKNTNDFLNKLKGALGLGKGQLLGNLLQCAAALSGQVGGAISAVESFAIGTGAAKVLGNTTNILNTSKLPNWGTKVTDCIKCGSTLTQAKDAVNLINSVGKSPMSMMSSNVPGLGNSVLDISKLDNVSTGSSHFASSVLGSDKLGAVKQASKLLPTESPKGSRKFYDGIYTDVDSATKQVKKMAAAGMSYA